MTSYPEVGGFVAAETKTPEIATTRETRVARLAKSALRLALGEYLKASAHFRAVGAQTPSSEYGGSRSMIYYQMLDDASTLGEIVQARRTYKGLHNEQAGNHDESGALLRIAGYYLKDIPIVSTYLENKVREDDRLMAQAAFEYPEGRLRYSASLDNLPDLGEERNLIQ